MSEIEECAVIEGRALAISGGTFKVLEARFKSSNAEISNQTPAAWLKILVKKPQEHNVRLQFMPKSVFSLSSRPPASSETSKLEFKILFVMFLHTRNEQSTVSSLLGPARGKTAMDSQQTVAIMRTVRPLAAQLAVGVS